MIESLKLLRTLDVDVVICSVAIGEMDDVARLQHAKSRHLCKREDQIMELAPSLRHGMILQISHQTSARQKIAPDGYTLAQ